MSDLISRQQAIDAWKSDFKGYVDCLDLPRDDYNGIMEYIDEAPSAQPEIIRCHECAKRRTLDCPMGITVFDAPPSDGYCYKAERRNDG